MIKKFNKKINLPKVKVTQIVKVKKRPTKIDIDLFDSY